MMKVSFAEVDEAYIRSKVQNGYYSSVTELVRDAVRRLRESEQNKLSAALEIGERAVSEGRVKLLTSELFEEVFERGLAKADRGEKIIRPDAAPY